VSIAQAEKKIYISMNSQRRLPDNVPAEINKMKTTVWNLDNGTQQGPLLNSLTFAAKNG
jgi:hypothetical protein